MDQIRKRVGLPKKAIKRHLERVIKEGVRLAEHKDSRLRRWADWARNHYSADIYYMFWGFVYAFARKGIQLEFVTVLYPPHAGAWEN